MFNSAYFGFTFRAHGDFPSSEVIRGMCTGRALEKPDSPPGQPSRTDILYFFKEAPKRLYLLIPTLSFDEDK